MAYADRNERLAAGRAHYKANKAKYIARSVAWRKANPEKWKALTKRARQKAAAIVRKAKEQQK